MSCRPITHGRCGPLAGRLEQLVERAKAECRLRAEAECRLEDLTCRRTEYESAISSNQRPKLCRTCGIPLLPKEVDICRHCAADKAEPESR